MAKQQPKIGSTAELAELLMLTVRRVNQLVNEEVLTREADGTFNIPKAISDYYEFKYADDGDADYMAEKAKHEMAKRQLAELELAKRQGQVHDAEDVEMVMTDMLTNIRSQLLALPTTMAPLLCNKDKGYISKVLTEEIENRLAELSDYSPALFEGVDNGNTEND